MNDTTDRRVQKTQAALLGAFLKLLLEVGYDKLKIASVAELANVGRSTFYEHYRTKRDLLKASVSQPFAHLANLVDPGANHTYLPNILLHFREQNQIARVLLNGPTRPLLSAVLANLILEQLKKRALVRPLIAPEIIARQIAEAQLALLEVWVLGRPACELERIVKALLLTTDALVVSLENQA
ncbi:MAG TPA: helix-turn-helix domain-containing protein [Burkholderiaceae bacterium]|jgi:AcrR family transcriptional regulator|nr:helix-turn-helix domain-containing protein [Burkholderiaceae bacterium]